MSYILTYITYYLTPFPYISLSGSGRYVLYIEFGYKQVTYREMKYFVTAITISWYICNGKIIICN